jgi:GNAT superfamily N-acetyltransferase
VTDGLSIRAVPYRSAVAATLVTAALAELAQRYGGGDGDATPIDPGQFTPPAGVFLVAWLDAEPVGCGGWRTYHADPAVAELKRMYTVPGARGLGVARAVLRALEDTAREAGRKRMILETGHLQPEAISLYVTAGYARIPDFGHYKDEPDVLSFGRAL